MSTTVSTKILTDKKFPFCPGCGHGIAIRNLAKVLQQLGYRPQDVAVVSDIGCSGLIDPLFATHTIHGLHGRSPALGLGVAMGLQQKPGKKTIAFIGDGGATIGLQHILEAARRNVDMTLIVLNNQLYGMTGGQISGLTTRKFKEIIDFETDVPAFNLVHLAHASGARFAARVDHPKQMPEVLKRAVETEGFALIEIASLCTSYAFKRLDELMDVVQEEEVLENPRPATQIRLAERPSLLDRQEIIHKEYEPGRPGRYGFVLAGSAGGGVQSVGKFLATAGMRAGLHATMKGEYPITVGTGFSVAEVIFDHRPIRYTGIDDDFIGVIVTTDGLEKIRKRITPGSRIYLDEKLKDADLPAREVIVRPFTKYVNRKSAALLATAYMLRQEQIIPLEALRETLTKHRLAKVFLETLDKLAELDG